MREQRDKKLIITTVDNINPKNKEKLTKAGYLVIEAKMPSSVYFGEQNQINGNHIMMSALMSIGHLNSEGVFHKELYRRLKEHEASNPSLLTP